jgi:hypothetical protein
MSRCQSVYFDAVNGKPRVGRISKLQVPPPAPAKRTWPHPSEVPSCGHETHHETCESCQIRQMAEAEEDYRQAQDRDHALALEAYKQAVSDSHPVAVQVGPDLGRMLVGARPLQEGDSIPAGGDLVLQVLITSTLYDHKAQLPDLAYARHRGATVVVVMSGHPAVHDLYRSAYLLHRLSPAGRETWMAVGGPLEPYFTNIETPDRDGFF